MTLSPIGLRACRAPAPERHDVPDRPLSAFLPRSTARSVRGIRLGAVPTALGYTTWSYALSRMPAGQLGVSTYIVPPVTIVLSLVLFAEVPALLAIVGGVVALVGVALSRRRPAASGVPEASGASGEHEPDASTHEPDSLSRSS